MTIALTPFNLDGMDRLEATHISTNLCYFLLASLEKKRWMHLRLIPDFIFYSDHLFTLKCFPFSVALNASN